MTARDVCSVLLGLCLLPTPAARADNAVPGISEGERFTQQDGESLYRAICQSCHMADGRGAQGAGAYPSLAGNAKLANAPYLAYTVLHGRKGMPPFQNLLTDQQVAEITNFVRTHLGNHAMEPIGASEVKALR